MHLLESPLEALAFRYSAALAGSVWAWFAIVFAALGLWRIRTVGPSSTKPDSQPQPPKKLTPISAPTVTAGLAENKLLTASRPSCHVEGGDWSVTKGRFTAYFHVEGEIEEEKESDGVTDVDCEEETETEMPLSKLAGMKGDLGWHRQVDPTAGMRGHLGWYRQVDLTALDGSVVRLWDRDGGLPRQLVQG